MRQKTLSDSTASGALGLVRQRGLLLRFLLIFSLVWLPLAGMANTNVAAHSSNATTVNMHQHHDMANRDAASHDRSTMSDQSASLDCGVHQAACCSVCVSYCKFSISVGSSLTTAGTDRYQRYTVPISIVVLARDIRPPIV